jgi:hypothetical protein
LFRFHKDIQRTTGRSVDTNKDSFFCVLCDGLLFRPDSKERAKRRKRKKAEENDVETQAERAKQQRQRQLASNERAKRRKRKKAEESDVEAQAELAKRQRESRQSARERETEAGKDLKWGESTFLSDGKKRDCILMFEEQTRKLKQSHCSRCRCVGINLKMSDYSDVCLGCSKLSEDDALTNKLLPIWVDDNGVVQYSVPDVLLTLTDAEKMLIQILSPFVPLHHIKHGTLGLKGHVCCFPQSVDTVCKVFPRLPSDVTVVKMVQTYQNEIGGGSTCKAFKVRRYSVLRSLHWLKRHHKCYCDVEIDEENLSWMDGAEESYLRAALELPVVHDAGEQVRCLGEKVNDDFRFSSVTFTDG